MLLVFMYHRIANIPNGPALFAQHLQYLAANFPIVLPGDKLDKNNLSVCLTFDDAYFDFYQIVFPLLKKFNLKAVVAIPVKFISEETTLTSAARLNLAVDYDIQPTEGLAAFCTWPELREMIASDHVVAASHSYNHVDLTRPNINLTQEIVQSKQVLEQKLNRQVNTFVYPFGKWNLDLHHAIIKEYTYAMRIGSAINYHWHNYQKITYRIDADHFWQKNINWSRWNTVKYSLKYLSNQLRKR